MSLSKSFDLERSKSSLSALGYVARRLIDMESAWITDFSEFDEKISLGLGIGFTSDVLEKITGRIDEQNTITPEYVSRSQEVINLFDKMTQEKDQLAIQKFIRSASQSLLNTFESLRERINPLYDQPTTWAINGIVQHLNDKLSMFEERKWPVSEQEFPDIFAIDCSPVTWGEGTIQPDLCFDAARPEILVQSNQNTLMPPKGKDLLDTIDGRRRFVHFIYADIEIAAAEICARNIVEYGAQMPPQFTYDMARQTSDEARHAVMAEEMLAEFGGKLGDYTYKNHVWAAYMQGDTLAEKLAIEQIIGEGNGLDTTELSRGLFVEKGLSSLLDYYTFLQADETIHCAFGNRWIKHLVGDSDQAYNAVVDSALEKTGGSVPGFAPVIVSLRRAGEFPETFIQNRLLIQ